MTSTFINKLSSGYLRFRFAPATRDLDAGRKDGRRLMLSVHSAPIFPVFLIILLALVLRLINLDTSLWYDEGFTGHLSRQTVNGMTAFLSREDVHPPLYFSLTQAWEQLFGGDFALRCLSVVLGTATVPAFFACCKRLIGYQTALAASAFLAVSPFHVHLSQEVRPYALYMLLAVVGIWLLVRTSESTTVVTRWGFGYSLAAALLLYTHGVAPLVLSGFGAFYLCISAHGVWKALRQLLLYNAIAIVLFLPWALTIIQQAARADVHNWIPEVSVTSILTTMQWFVYSPPLEETGRFVHLLWLLPPTLLFFSNLSVKDRLLRRKIYGLSFCVLVPVGLISVYGYFISPVFVPRVLAPIILPLFMLLAVPLTVFKNKFLCLATRMLAIAFLLFSLLSVTLSLRSRGNTDWRGAAADVAVRASPDDAIVIMPTKAKYVFGYYYQSTERTLLSITEENEAREAIPELLKAHRRVWIIRDDIVASGDTEDGITFLKQNFYWKQEGTPRNLTFLSVGIDPFSEEGITR